MNKEIANYIRRHETKILEDWMHEMQKKVDERSFSVISDQVFLNTSKEFMELVFSNLLDTEEEYNGKIGDFAANIVRLGWPLSFLSRGIRTFRTILFKEMTSESKYNVEQIKKLVLDFENWLSPMQDKMVETYSDTWEKTINLQKIALQELSAPLIPVFEKISIMPLVGTIDTERARLIMENLLTGVVRHRSEVVLIDITGVPVVDTMVAHHIIQAADAVRLVGAKCMIVGIRPEIAQTIVNLGIDLNHITTTSTLQKGMGEALRFTNREIVSVEGLD
ncbi:RsbT co-antagonist protein RsbRA [Bacillus niameyensis]|uniref:RsbT co-antagonist protein RsbRA n=1 Tax=Bacillus niameyensis TaxID=1522308 RepID=UPI000780FFDF|nr:RsbT co-antagonist protein RsbRA [Bacillus niameyensis]